MNQAAWGLLGPEKLPSERRVRTLEVGAVVRLFNDLAVPGMGNVYFGKQLLLATMGVAIAEHLRTIGRSAQNIDTANAVEALACFLALKNNRWESDPRLRGATKMRDKTDISFSVVKNSSFYVTQPMRMATVQPMRALGLVESESERFNAFSIAQTGREFIDAVCDFYPPKKVFDPLLNWARGNGRGIKNSEVLREALSPLVPLPKNACAVLLGSIIRGGSEEAKRRKTMLAWVDKLRDERAGQIAWDDRPAEIADDHWRDLRTGALFFAVRESALVLLDQIEAQMGNQEEPRLKLGPGFPSGLNKYIRDLKKEAEIFLENNHDPSASEQAGAFCRECIDTANVVEKLVKRDNRILRLGDNAIIPGPAFQGKQVAAENVDADDEDDDAKFDRRAFLPENISRRVYHLFRMNLDLHGKLSE